VIGCFLGSERDSARRYEPVRWAQTIDDAAVMAMEAAGLGPRQEAALPTERELPRVGVVRAGWSDEQRYLRGVFAGGTFCYQAQQILGAVGPVYSNSPIQPRFKLADPDVSRTLNGKSVQRVIVVPNRIVNLVV